MDAGVTLEGIGYSVSLRLSLFMIRMGELYLDVSEGILVIEWKLYCYMSNPDPNPVVTLLVLIQGEWKLYYYMKGWDCFAT